MTELELRAVPPFGALPVYDESDEQSHTLTRPREAGYPGVRACWTVDEVRQSLADPTLVPLGAVRTTDERRRIVVAAYFGEQSPAGGPGPADTG